MQLTKWLNKRSRPPGGNRILAYCASNVGMGPLGRLARVLNEVKRHQPDTSILVITDSRDTSLLRAANIAAVILPKYHFVDGSEYKEEPEFLRIGNQELRDLRSELILRTLISFQPDLFFLDTNPHGKRDEVLPAVRQCTSKGIPACLMMRDIPALPDGPFHLRGTHAEIRRHAEYYSRIIVAGDLKFFDVASEYHWPETARDKLVYAGFIVPPPAIADIKHVFASFKFRQDGRVIVATFGGGWNAEPMAASVINAVAHLRKTEPDVQLLLITGPGVGEDHFKRICASAASQGGMAAIQFTHNLSEFFAAADALVMQAGSTVYHGLSLNKPMLVLVRDYKNKEQDARAERLKNIPGVHIEKTLPDADSMSGILRELLSSNQEKHSVPFSFNGADVAARTLIDLLPRKQ